MKNISMVIVALGAFTAALASGEIEVISLSAMGKAGYSGQQLSVKSAIALWNPEEKELKVGVFPVNTTDEDANKLREYQMMYYVIAEKKSPDPARWPSIPYLLVNIQFAEEKTSYKETDISAVLVNMVKWKDASTIGVNLPKEEIGSVIRHLFFTPGKLKKLTLEINEASDRSMAEGFRYSVNIPIPKPKR